MKRNSKLMKQAVNVYRTENYIVEQVLWFKGNDIDDAALFSNDTYYLRTDDRDYDYEEIFWARDNIDGKRIKTNMYSRKYID